jgi:hypothetical protein
MRSSAIHDGEAADLVQVGTKGKLAQVLSSR